MQVQYPLRDNDSINFDFPEDGALGVFISGGASSALLLYLVTKMVKESGASNPIYLLTGERLGQPYNLRYAQRVREKLQKIFDLQYPYHFCYIIPESGEHLTEKSQSQESKINGHYAKEFSSRYNIQTLFLADTLSQQDLGSNSFRFNPDGPKAKLIQRPFSKISKKELANLYYKENLLEDLFPITRSCEAGLKESHYYQKVCAQIQERTESCPKCQESELAFQEYL